MVGLGDQLVDLLDPHFDAVLAGQKSVGQLDHLDVDVTLNNAVAFLARGLGNRRGVGKQLEGIEGRNFVGLFGLGSPEPRNDAGIRLDPDIFADAPALHHRVMDDVAGRQTERGGLQPVRLAIGQGLAVGNNVHARNRLKRRQAGALDGGHHAAAVIHAE